MAGNERGVYFLPEVDDEVLVAFEHGDPRFPSCSARCGTARTRRRATNSDGKNNVRMIKSRSGHVIKLNDEDGKETIEIIDKTGKNSIVIDTAKEHAHDHADKDIVLVGGEGNDQAGRARRSSSSSSADTKIEAEGGHGR